MALTHATRDTGKARQDTSESRQGSADLPRRVGVWSAAAIVVGIIVGSGIFRVPSSIAGDIHATGTIAVLWMLGGIITLCLALSLGELAAMFPRAGGIYVYIREAYGPAMAFIYGWTFMFINPAVWAGVALIFAEYLGHFVPLTTAGRRTIAALLILFVTLANYRSVRLAVAVQNLAAVAKVVAIVAVAVAIFGLGSCASGALSAPISYSVPGGGSFGVALISVLFAYEGAASFCALSGEVRDPGRSLPRALTIGLTIVTVLYLLINAAYLYVLPLDEIAASRFVAADAVMRVAGPTAAGVVAGLVMLTTFGALAASALADPRVFYAMGSDGFFFRTMGSVHRRFLTPHVSILVAGAIAILYVSMHSFEELTAIFILGLWPFYALAALAVVVLRVKHPEIQRPYLTPLYPIVPLIFVASSILVLLNSLVEQPRVTLMNVAITLLGIPVYGIWRVRQRRRQAAPEK